MTPSFDYNQEMVEIWKQYGHEEDLKEEEWQGKQEKGRWN